MLELGIDTKKNWREIKTGTVWKTKADFKVYDGGVI